MQDTEPSQQRTSNKGALESPVYTPAFTAYPCVQLKDLLSIVLCTGEMHMAKQRSLEREVFLMLVTLANRWSLPKVDGTHLSLIGTIISRLCMLLYSSYRHREFLPHLLAYLVTPSASLLSDPSVGNVKGQEEGAEPFCFYIPPPSLLGLHLVAWRGETIRETVPGNRH